MPPIRVYADTSVFGGVFDPEFESASRTFFEQVQDGWFALVFSPLVLEEVDEAPLTVREFLSSMQNDMTIVQITPEVVRLSNAYIADGIVTQRSLTDSRHVAAATVSGCSMIVSWDFRDIVHFQKIPQYNAVNVASGYNEIRILSPSEVITHEEEV